MAETHRSGTHHAAHDHDHDDDHDHGHDDDHDHDHSGFWGRLLAPFHSHSHQKQEIVAEAAFNSTGEGIRTVWYALAALAVTTILQLIIVGLSGSVALLGDTIHNLGDALNSIPLLIAFYLARKAANRRYTYGYGRAEDVAGIFIVLSIVVSAAFILYESVRKLQNPEPMTNLGWVAAAAVIGFIGNELVATMQIRTGKRIGSAAMVADGQHARTDGFTSLAVLLAAGGTWLGYPIIDPIIGLLIGLVIVVIAWDSTRAMWYRLMDAVEPDLVDTIEQAARSTEGVQDVHDVRMRWFGHKLLAELHIVVDAEMPTHASHAIAERVSAALAQALPRLGTAQIHVDPR